MTNFKSVKNMEKFGQEIKEKPVFLMIELLL